MKISEIRETIADYRRQIDAYGYLVVYDSNWMTAVIETLLAREGEVLKVTHPGPRPPLSYPGEGVARLKWRQKREAYRAIRAILEGE